MSQLFLVSDQHIQIQQTAPFDGVLDNAAVYRNASGFVNSDIKPPADSCLVFDLCECPNPPPELLLISRHYPWLSMILIRGNGVRQEMLPVGHRISYVDTSTSETAFRNMVAEAISQSEIRYTQARNHERLQKALRSLTPRELQVLRLSSTGMTTRDIAESLEMSPSTADKHRRRALSKLGASTVVELVNTIIDVPGAWDKVV